MGELTVQFPLHRRVLSDFTFDDQRHSHPSKGLGVHELCHQCTVTGCLLTVCWILRWESRGTQSTSAHQHPTWSVVQQSYLLLSGLVEG